MSDKAESESESESVGINREGATASPSLINSKNHEPGFALDARVDERVFGHTIAWRNSFAWRTDIIDEIKANSRGFDLVTEARIAGAYVPRYSERIADAWLVVDKLGPYFRLTRGGYMSGDSLNQLKCIDDYEAEFAPKSPDEPFVYGRADTAPLAICLAALRAVDA